MSQLAKALIHQEKKVQILKSGALMMMEDMDQKISASWDKRFLTLEENKRPSASTVKILKDKL